MSRSVGNFHIEDKRRCALEGLLKTNLVVLWVTHSLLFVQKTN